MRAVGATKRKVGRPPTVNTLVPRQPASWESAAIAAQLQEILDALEVPPIDSETRGIFQRILYRQKYFGGDARGQVVITLRCIMESSGNESALIGPIVRAVSHCMTPELINRGLQLIEAFDRIPLVSVLETMRGLDVFSENSLGYYFSIAIRNKLSAILEPAGRRQASKRVRVRREPKPPRVITQVAGVAKSIALGLELLDLRRAVSHNLSFGRQVRHRFNIDGKHCAELMRAARVFGTRPEIYGRLSWNALVLLSSPTMSVSVRQDLEARIVAGESVGGPEIVRARGKLKTGRRRRPTDQPALRMAA